jgi:hypothetical protein
VAPWTTRSEDDLSFLNFFKAFADHVDLCDKVHQLWRLLTDARRPKMTPCTGSTIRMYEIIAQLTFPKEKGEENPSTQNTQRAILRLAVLTTNVQKRSSQAPAQAPLPLFLTP